MPAARLGFIDLFVVEGFVAYQFLLLALSSFPERKISCSLDRRSVCKSF